jgi:hypothetical protein
MKQMDGQLGAVARPARVYFATVLPKTRIGKLLRRALQAVAERRDPGDLTKMGDPAALQQVRDLVGHELPASVRPAAGMFPTGCRAVAGSGDHQCKVAKLRV